MKVLDLLNLPGIEPVDLRSENGSIVIAAHYNLDGTPLCPSCGHPMYRHGKRVTVVADTPMQMQPVRLEISRPRFRCGTCSVMDIPDLPFLDERRRATRRLVDAIRERCLSTTFHAMSQQTGLAVNTIKNIAHDLIADLERTVRYETPIIMGIDEVMIGGAYRCVITNLATNNLFDMLEARNQQHLKPYFAKLPNRDRVEWVCTDMWRPYRNSFEAYLPNAKLVIDKFHVVRMASDALEAERKRIQAKLDKDDRIKVKKSLRWFTLKRPKALSPVELRALDAVRANYPALALAYDFKETFYRIYDDPDKASAMRAFEAWENCIPAKGLNEFRSLARTVRDHYADIFAYWDSPAQITNAYTESLNGLIKIANCNGRGYSFEILRAKALYAKEARKVGRVIRLIGGGKAGVPTTETRKPVEYGPHIPTLVAISESGQLD